MRRAVCEGRTGLPRRGGLLSRPLPPVDLGVYTHAMLIAVHFSSSIILFLVSHCIFIVSYLDT